MVRQMRMCIVYMFRNVALLFKSLFSLEKLDSFPNFYTPDNIHLMNDKYMNKCKQINKQLCNGILTLDIPKHNLL